MSLYIVAIPIGNRADLTDRARQVLTEADVVIGEEKRELLPFLKTLGLQNKFHEFLNEHSKKEELTELVKLCETKKVALVSDCGTPGFCDPGAQLVALCRQKKIPVVPVPGASSLMTLLSVSGLPMKQFVFLGFLSSDKPEREVQLRDLKNEKRATVLMDTPYRLSRLLSELAQLFPERKAVLGLNLTQETEQILHAPLKQLSETFKEQKAEFILILEGRV
ncbi:MAG: 16S rRNA (cytidine(1402)-2'-O)-methyltransferase [Bdellovibrionales bacterium]